MGSQAWNLNLENTSFKWKNFGKKNFLQSKHNQIFANMVKVPSVGTDGAPLVFI